MSLLIEGILQGLQLRVDGKSAELEALREAVANARRLEAEVAERYQPYRREPGGPTHQQMRPHHSNVVGSGAGW